MTGAGDVGGDRDPRFAAAGPGAGGSASASFGDALLGPDGTGEPGPHDAFRDALANDAPADQEWGGFSLPPLPAAPGGAREAARAFVEGDALPPVRAPRVPAGQWGALQPAPGRVDQPGWDPSPPPRSPVPSGPASPWSTGPGPQWSETPWSQPQQSGPTPPATWLPTAATPPATWLPTAATPARTARPPVRRPAGPPAGRPTPGTLRTSGGPSVAVLAVVLLVALVVLVLVS